MMVAKSKSVLFFLLAAMTYMAPSVLAKKVDDLERVFGGEDVEPGEYPYYVYMGGCGGALIAPDIVLFAAHCRNHKDAELIVGAYKRGSLDEGAQERICEEWVGDPKYGTEGSPYNYDFALCKLNAPVTINSDITLELNEMNSFPKGGDNLIAIGFGYDIVDNDFVNPGILQDVTVPAKSKKNCKSYHGDDFTDIMLCAGFEEDKGVCYGDSGGPLIKREKKNDGTIMDTHVGVVSWGQPGCVGKPAVYARTSENIKWIKETSCNMGSIAGFCDDIPPPPPCDQDLTITLITDAYADETSWIFMDSEEEEVMKVEELARNYEYKHKLCLKSDECYDFTIKDSYGDGMCYGGECGSYSFTLNGEEIISEKGDFKYERTETFCTGDGGDIPSSSPEGHGPDCEDDESFEFKNNPKKNCEWVGKGQEKRIKKRCKKEWLGEKVYEWCPKTCAEKVGLGSCS